MRKSILTTITFLFFITAAHAELLDLEKKLEYKYKKSEKEHSFEVCPDNTCKLFQAPITTSKALLSKFIVIHDCSGWGYNYSQFSKFCEANKDLVIKLIQEVGGKACAKKSAEVQGKCSLKKLALEGKITIGSERSDEGKTCHTTYDLEDSLEKRANPKHPVKSDCHSNSLDY